MTVQVGVVVGQKGSGILLTFVVGVSTVIQSHKCFLFHGLSDVFDRVASPDLPRLDNSARRNNWVRSYDASFLEDSTFHDDWVVTHIDAFHDSAGIQGTVVLNDWVSQHEELGSLACRWAGGCVEDAVVTDTDVVMQTI